MRPRSVRAPGAAGTAAESLLPGGWPGPPFTGSRRRTRNSRAESVSPPGEGERGEETGLGLFIGCATGDEAGNGVLRQGDRLGVPVQAEVALHNAQGCQGSVQLVAGPLPGSPGSLPTRVRALGVVATLPDEDFRTSRSCRSKEAAARGRNQSHASDRRASGPHRSSRSVAGSPDWPEPERPATPRPVRDRNRRPGHGRRGPSPAGTGPGHDR